MEVLEIHHDKSLVCREILDDLPAWFGQAAAKDAYAAAAVGLAMFGVRDGTEPIGFVSLKAHTADAAELYFLGVKRRFHRRGIGRALIGAALARATEDRRRFLTVKTLAPSHPDRHYAATRRFYEAAGFLPVEVFPTLWGAEHPCLLMIRPI